jgi:alpha-tubulin suppressor-like RCC1 family protein
MGIGAYPNGAYPTPQLILTGEPVRIVTANDGFSYIAIGQSGNIYSWGSNTYGVLLDGYTMMGSARYSVQDVTDYVNALLAPGETVADIYTGGTGTYVLTSAGRLFFAGDGSNCAAAFDNGGAAIATPMDITANIPLVNGEKITQIIPGLRRAIALTDQGNAYSWGQNNYLQTGIPPVSAQVCTPGNLNSALGLPADEYIVSGSSTANSSTTVLTNKGNLYFFGLTSFLLDGNAGGSVMEGLIATGVADANYIDMSASPTPQGMLFVLKDDGTVWVAGNSPYGMGDGTTNAQTSLNDITSYLGLATGETVVKIATSRNGIGIFLTSDGRVLTFGKGNMGILGTGNLNNQFSPVDITPNLQSQTACPLTGVYIGDKAAQYELINDHLLHVIVPPGDSYGYVDLRVVGCESVTVPQGYEYVHSICAR